jgi:hypothetical protein
MHHSELEEQLSPVLPIHNGSSLQAILYIDREAQVLSPEPPFGTPLRRALLGCGLIAIFGGSMLMIDDALHRHGHVHRAIAKHTAPVPPRLVAGRVGETLKVNSALPVASVVQHIAPRIAAIETPLQHHSVQHHVVARPLVVRHALPAPVHIAARKPAAKLIAIRPIVRPAAKPQVVAVEKLHPRPHHTHIRRIAQTPIRLKVSHVHVVVLRHSNHRMPDSHPFRIAHIEPRRMVALLALPQPTVHDAALQPVQVASASIDPTIVSFTISPQTIPAGSGASICVAARHATQLSISGIGEVNPLLLDCRHVNPLVTTTYTAWAVNNLGVTVSENVKITVTH